MRTISAAMEKVLAGPYATHVRAQIKDSGGTWRDMTALDGRDWLLACDWGETVDQSVADANVSLARDVSKLSLSPMMEGSKLNLLTGSFAALVRPGREIKIETSTVPSGIAPASGDWSLAFRGYIESVDPSGSEIRLQCSDLGSRLNRAMIKAECVYPAMPDYHQAPVWTANTAFEDIWPADARTGAIRPTVANGCAYLLFDGDGGSTGVVEPTWPTTVGASVVDGGLKWHCMGPLPAHYGATMWEQSKAVALNDVVAVETGSGYLGAYRCSTAGMTSPDAYAIGTWGYLSPSTWRLTPTAANSTLYRVTVAGTNCDFTSDASATVAEICAGLTSAINALTGTHGLTATNGNSFVTLAGAWRLVRCSSLIATSSAPDGTAAWRAMQDGSYSPFSGRVLLEDLLDMLLRDWAGVTNLAVPVSSAWVVGEYQQSKVSVLSALDSLSAMIGWCCRYKYSATAGDFLPTLYCPDRAKATVDRVFGTDDYDSIDSLALSLEGVRNAIDVVYSDTSASPIDGVNYPRKTISVSDATSIADYGEQWGEIALASTDLIDTAAEATALANSVLSDLKDPLAEQSVSMRLFQFVELDDRYTFAANGIHYDADQTFAIVGYRHSFSGAESKTTLQCRARPSGGFKRWHKRLSKPGGAPLNRTQPTPIPGVTVTNKAGAVVVAIDSWWPTTESADLYISSSAGLTPSASNFALKSRSSKLYYPLAAGTYFGRVIVRDRSGNPSAPSAEFVLRPA